MGIHQRSTSKCDFIWILFQASEKFQCFWESLEGRERERNLSFDSLLIWDNLNPALMQIQGCSTTQLGPTPQLKQICGELKARMADSESEPLSFANLSSCGRWSCACGGTCLHNGHLGLLGFFFNVALQVLGKMEAGRTCCYFIHAASPHRQTYF